MDKSISNKRLTARASREFYKLVLDNDEVQELSDGDFRFWVKLRALLALQGREKLTNGDVSYLLKVRRDHCDARLKRLEQAKLIVYRNPSPPPLTTPPAEATAKTITRSKLAETDSATEVVQ